VCSHLHVFWPSLCVLLLKAECNVQAHVLGVCSQPCFQLVSIQHTARQQTRGAAGSLVGRVIDWLGCFVPDEPVICFVNWQSSLRVIPKVRSEQTVLYFNVVYCPGAAGCTT
jgi:hypothetical protein